MILEADEAAGSDADSLSGRLRAMGLNQPQLEAVARALSLKQGVELITGPPGTGKTEMLSALLEVALETRRCLGAAEGAAPGLAPMGP